MPHRCRWKCDHAGTNRAIIVRDTLIWRTRRHAEPAVFSPLRGRYFWYTNMYNWNGNLFFSRNIDERKIKITIPAKLFATKSFNDSATEINMYVSPPSQTPIYLLRKYNVLKLRVCCISETMNCALIAICQYHHQWDSHKIYFVSHRNKLSRVLIICHHGSMPLRAEDHGLHNWVWLTMVYICRCDSW